MCKRSDALVLIRSDTPREEWEVLVNQFISPAIQNGLAVFVGPVILWSLVKFGTLIQRSLCAAFAAGVSALASFFISNAIAG